MRVIIRFTENSTTDFKYVFDSSKSNILDDVQSFLSKNHIPYSKDVSLFALLQSLNPRFYNVKVHFGWKKLKLRSSVCSVKQASSAILDGAEIYENGGSLPV